MKGNCFTHCTMNLANVQEKHQSCTEKNIWPQNCWGLWTLAGPKPPLQQGPMTVGVWSKFLIYLYNKTTNYWFLIFLSVRFGDIRCWSKWDNVSHIYNALHSNYAHIVWAPDEHRPGARGRAASIGSNQSSRVGDEQKLLKCIHFLF